MWKEGWTNCDQPDRKKSCLRQAGGSHKVSKKHHAVHCPYTESSIPDH